MPTISIMFRATASFSPSPRSSPSSGGFAVGRAASAWLFTSSREFIGPPRIANAQQTSYCAGRAPDGATPPARDIALARRCRHASGWVIRPGVLRGLAAAAGCFRSDLFRGKSQSMSLRPDVLIVGAGLAGLCCARRLAEAGTSFQIVEASDGIGGRVRTDNVDGFLLDRGFQVLLEGYPEARQVLDYDALELKAFDPGALIWFAGRMNRFIDPWRKTGEWRAAYDSPVGSFIDKLRLARLRLKLKGDSIEKIFSRPEKSTMAELKSVGFSPAMIQHFF